MNNMWKNVRIWHLFHNMENICIDECEYLFREARFILQTEMTRQFIIFKDNVNSALQDDI